MEPQTPPARPTMKVALSNLWRWDGVVGRGEFCAWGVVLFAVKYQLDRLLSALWLGKSWTLFDREQAQLYLWQGLPSNMEPSYLLALLGVSLPFLWAGVVLTLRRLRALGWPPWWVGLFFVPVVKLAFFAVLCAIPSRDQTVESTAPPGEPRRGGWFRALIPRSAVGSTVAALAFSLVATIVPAWLGTMVLRNYGWALFV